jgi:hypothetical protein
MSNEMIALSRRAVACKGWKWLAGMLAVELAGPGMSLTGGRPVRVDDCWHAVNVWRPDLTDPATLGCLLALVREAWRCPTVYVRQSTTRRVSDGVIAWEVCDLFLDAQACRALGVPREGSVGSWGHGSEAEALVAALESAP